MVSLKNKILNLLLFIPIFAFGQTYNYTFTDPCTLIRQSIVVPADGTVALNYFGTVGTFNQQDFSNGAFDNWIANLSQSNSSSPCQSVTGVIVNEANGTAVSNTLTVTTNVMSVMGGGMLPPAGSVNNSSNGNNSDQSPSQTNGGSNSSTTEGSGDSNQSTGGGEQKTESSIESSTESSGTQSTANSLSNATDGGGTGGSSKKKSNKAQRQAGSLIASGDIVVISNTNNTEPGQMRFVGSITHSNTTNTRIKGALLTYTTVTNDASVTLYKSWINPKKTFNLVLANTTSTNFNSNILNTTTALESFRFGKGKKFTGMAGVNFTYGKLGERTLQNLSSVAGVHRNFRISPRISTSLLVLGVYSPFTQFYEGKWWDAGALIVPFSSWDIKITKTFKYNISFTGVYQTSGNFLNYQILTGGKLNF